MKKLTWAILIVPINFNIIAQTRISGVVKTSNGERVPGANITLVHSYDGASTDTAGVFSFSTSENGVRLLRYTAIGFKADSVKVNLHRAPIRLTLLIKPAVSELNAVNISAGTLEASDTKKGAVLSSLDIVTTAGAVADVVAALQTLPGTGQAFSENGLFVRGGSAAETRAYFDGMQVQNLFGSQLPYLSSRSRFSPFLFKGTTFSTGGYSAQYGQALSSALLLESKELPEKSSTELSLLSVGLGAARTERFKNSSLTLGGVYYNLRPSYSFTKQNVKWEQFPIGETANLQYKWKPTKNGIFKVFVQYSNNDVSLFSSTISPGNLVHVIDHNKNMYTNLSYKDLISGKWQVQAGVSTSNTQESGKLDSNGYRRNNHLLQARLTLTRYFAGRSLLRAGTEAYVSGSLEGWNGLSRTYQDNLQAAFTEAEIFLSDDLVVRLGGRAEHSSYLRAWNLAPRTSFALKTGLRSQLSTAYGLFYQNPDDTYLLQSHQLGYERAIHYLINYQYLISGQSFRIEAYYKQYAHLTKFDFNGSYKDYGVINYKGLNNGGSGYARGIDIFWRNKTTVSGGDYYVSYSFLDTKRNFRDYPALAVPPFAARHTLNVVYKQYVPFIQSELSAAYSFSSGRTYYNPNNPVFLGDQTKNFNNLSFNISYLTRIFKQYAVVYGSVNNAPGFNNIYGYNYSSNGSLRAPILPAARRNFLFGVLVNIGDNSFNH